MTTNTNTTKTTINTNTVNTKTGGAKFSARGVPKMKRRVRLGGLAAGLTAAASLLAPVSPVEAAGPDGLATSTIADDGATTPTAKAASSRTGETHRRMPAAPSDKLVPPNCGIVPDVVGMTIEKAIATIEAASPLFWVHLDYGFVPEGQAEIGTIFAQSQAPGTLLFDCDGQSTESGIFITAVLNYAP